MAVQNLANSRLYNLDKSGNASSGRWGKAVENASKFEAVNAIARFVTGVADGNNR